MEHFLPRFQVKTKKKKVFTKNGTLFLNTNLRSDAHQSQIIGGDADEDHTQIVGGIQSNYWGDKSPPCFGTTALLGSVYAALWYRDAPKKHREVYQLERLITYIW